MINSILAQSSKTYQLTQSYMESTHGLIHKNIFITKKYFENYST